MTTPTTPNKKPSPDNDPFNNPNDEQLEAMLAELKPNTPSPELAERVGRSFEGFQSEPGVRTAVIYRITHHPAFRGAMAAGILLAVTVGLIVNQPPSNITSPRTAIHTTPPSEQPTLTNAPSLLAYNRAMRQSPDALEALLDQPRRLSYQHPLSVRSDITDIE